MRVTKIMQDYIHECVERKVADRFAAAVKAMNDQGERDAKAVKAVTDYADGLISAMTEKVAAFAKKQGLTWIPHPFDGWGDKLDKDANVAFRVCINTDDFEETCQNKSNESARKKMRDEIRREPARIREAIDKTVNALVFSLELGKVKKAELEELIASTEVEL